MPTVAPVCSKCGGPLEGATGETCQSCLMRLSTVPFGASNPQVEVPLQPGAMFHGLEIVQILGRGGMGVVYKARQPQLDRFVAVKILPQALAADAEFTSRFLLEAKALASLTHPNIVSVFDYGKEGERSFIVMEYIDGTSLRAIMKTQKLAPEEALKIIPLLCDALEFAHQEGIVHRDIKPENILMDKRGRVKVADFGLAKMVRGDAKTVVGGLTQTGVAMGTPHYMAPEQFENTRSVDHRADIYSMGVIFYEMLTGELPIGRFELPSKTPGIDSRLDEIVLRTLEKSPDKRFQSMSEVRRELTNMSTVQPVSIPTPPTIVHHRGTPWIWVSIASVLASVVLFMMMKSEPPADPSPTNAGVTTPTPTPTPASPSPTPAPVKDPWAAATIEVAEQPKGWKRSQDDWNGESRQECAEASAWFGMQSQAEGIKRARRVALAGPNDWKISIFAWQFGEGNFLDESIKIFQKSWLPQQNHFLLDKENVLVLVSGQHEGRVAPAAEEIEDTLRRKLGLQRARRRDTSMLRAEDYPAGWEDLGSRQTDLTQILAKVSPIAAPPVNELRDGWMSTLSNRNAKDQGAEIISLRFFESDPARLYRQALRTADPPKDKELRVLQNYDRVVAIFTPLAGDARNLDQIVAALVRSMGSGADDIALNAEPIEISFTNEWLIVPFRVEGLNNRDLARSGSWKLEAWGLPRKGFEKATTCPDDVMFKEGRQQVHLRFGVDGEVRRFLETRPTWMHFRITWSDSKDARPIEFQISLENKFPPAFDQAFGSRFPKAEDLPLGWQIMWRVDREQFPLIATDPENCADALEVLGDAGRAAIHAVDMAYLGRFEPEGKTPPAGFKALAVLVLRIPEPAAKAAFLRALAGGATPKWDRKQVADKDDIVSVTLLAGSNAEAASAFDKLAAAMKRRLE